MWSAASCGLNVGMNETMDQLAMENSVHWYVHVLRREDGHVLRRALHFRLMVKE